MRRLIACGAIAAFTLAVPACASGNASPQAEARHDDRTSAPASSATASSSPVPDPAEVGANELGMVPVLMYHRLEKQPSDVYTRTPQQFRQELERLAREGYVPVTARDYVTGNIDIPAGEHAVVLTFDDSTHDQLAFDSSGKPRPDTAVGILLSVAAEYPDFRPVATFFVNHDPFALPDNGKQALRWLHEHGFEIGNHTYGHENLGTLSATEVRRQLAKLQATVRSTVPDATITTMALPLGVSPDQPKLAAHGTWNGVSYDYDGVFLVGARPAPSPFDEDFDPLAIPRIRSQGLDGPDAKYCSTHWLNYLEKHPEERYTSDGDPTRISFPKGEVAEFSEDVGGTANPYSTKQ